MKKPTNKNRQYGFSMVEVLISVGISAFLMLIVATMFSSTSNARALQTSLSGINESGRFAVSMLSRDLRMAGYIDSDWFNASGLSPVQVWAGIASSGGDQISIRYQAARDCNYASTGSGGVATNTYRVDATTLTLQCNNEPMVEDIEQMQIHLGVDVDADGVANRFVPAGTVGVNMSQVVSIRINLLVRSADDLRAIDPQTYVFDDSSITATDRRIRRQYSMTVSMRNPM